MIRPWAGWKWARGLWFLVLGVFLMLFPFMSADYVCMIPTFILVVFASGPLFRLAGLKPSCRQCRLEL